MNNFENTKAYKAIKASLKIFYAGVMAKFIKGVSNDSDLGFEAVVASASYKALSSQLSSRFIALETAIANSSVKQTLKGTALREIKQSLTPAAKKYLRANIMDRVTSIDDTIKDRIKSVLQDLVKEDPDLLKVREVLREELKDVLSNGKIDTIAVTEFRTGYNYGQNHALESLTKELEDDEKIVRVWDSAGDGSVRQSHADMDGEERDIDERFSNGLLYPAEPGQDPAETINCRCSINAKIIKK